MIIDAAFLTRDVTDLRNCIIDGTRELMPFLADALLDAGMVECDTLVMLRNQSHPVTCQALIPVDRRPDFSGAHRWCLFIQKFIDGRWHWVKYKNYSPQIRRKHADQYKSPWHPVRNNVRDMQLIALESDNAL